MSNSNSSDSSEENVKWEDLSVEEQANVRRGMDKFLRNPYWHSETSLTKEYGLANRAMRRKVKSKRKGGKT